MSGMPKLDKHKYGPWAVIAGGSDGTGAEFARAIAASGINLLLIARRAAALEALAGELRAAGVEVRTLCQDLSAADAMANIRAATAGLEVGLFISNAGADTAGKAFLDAPVETWLGLIDRNVRCVTALCHQFAGPMRTRGRGGIILMASGTGLGGMAGVAVYSATKGFELNLAEGLWQELHGAGVQVLGVAAPAMATPTLVRTLEAAGLSMPGLVEPRDAVRKILETLEAGPLYVFPTGVDDVEAVMAARRDRTVRLADMAAKFFGKGEA